MSFQMQLIQSTAERNRLNKKPYFQKTWACEGELKDNTSVINPTIIIKKTTPVPQSAYNYLYIGEFKRYYYIENITSLYENMWQLDCRVDVLMSFAADILATKCIISKTGTSYQRNMYLNDGSFVMDSHRYNQVKKFQNGLSDSGHNILICAGGGSIAAS